MKKETKAEYDSLRDARLAAAKEASQKEAAAKKAAKAAFSERQKQIREADEAEKQRVATYRKDALEKPTLGSPLPPWDGLHKTSPIKVNTLSQPVHWQYFTAKKHGWDGVNAATQGTGAEHEEAMATLPSNVDLATLDSFVKNITKNSSGLVSSAAEVRRQQAAVDVEKAAKEVKEREQAALAMREEQRKKAAMVKAAEAAKVKQIKKEMAEQTAKEKKDAAEKAKIRAEKAQIERVAMVAHLMVDTKLRDEDEIANERREGSSMSKGSKADFVDAAKAEGGDMSKF